MNETEVREAVAAQEAYIAQRRAVRDKNCPSCRMAYGCECRDEAGAVTTPHAERVAKLAREGR